MKIVNQVCRFLTGFLFIFSGLIKLNDPYGLAYKMEEYFEVFSTDFSPVFEELIPYSLFLSIFISALEVALGVAILLYYRMKTTMWITLGLIMYFTFLTFYAWYFDRLKECGCFGDFIKLSAKASFFKDIILLVFILILFWQRRKLQSFLSVRVGDILTGGSLALAIFVGYFAVEHLPYFDFRPYKVGNNIAALMRAEESPRYKYVMQKDGKKYEFAQYPSDPGFKLDTFILMNPEKIYPAITDYSIFNEEGDFTDSSLHGVKFLIAVPNVEKIMEDEEVLKKMNPVSSLLRELPGLSVQPMLITSSSAEAVENFRHEAGLGAPYYFADGTVLKTMVRANPGFLLLKEGTVIGKWHYNNIPTIEEIRTLSE